MAKTLSTPLKVSFCNQPEQTTSCRFNQLDRKRDHPDGGFFLSLCSLNTID